MYFEEITANFNVPLQNTPNRTQGQMQRVYTVLSTTNLSLGHRRDPADQRVKAHGYDSNDPNGLSILPGKVTEDDGKDDASKVTGGTGASTDNAIGVWVDVWHK